MDAGSLSSVSLPTGPQRFGQACDRCRKKKTKCDGASPSCGSCDKAGLLCEVSATLLRNRKVRGFTTDQQQFEEVQDQLAKCQESLRVEKERNAMLQQDAIHQEQVRPTPDRVATFTTSTTQPGPVPAEKQTHSDSAYIIKHMGRLVHDERGIGRFAGSTTGVHFVLTVEQECQTSLAMPGAFPASCFRLFLAQPCPLRNRSSLTGSSDLLRDIRSYFTSPAPYYFQQIRLFIQTWDAFCPVLARDQIMGDSSSLLDDLNRNETGHLDYSTAMALLMIIRITRFSEDAVEPDDTIAEFALSHQLLDKVMMQRDTKSLQALILFSLYNQLNGHCLAMTALNGSMVILAQSLGLHRHARRFKMPAGEIELRKRLWWWVYVFDRITSILHGLPPLIDDADVDNDMPTDCHLQGLGATGLSHPLPGERTDVFFFIQYVALGRKVSRILDLLYTTTRRKDGDIKIAELDLELRMWNQNLKTSGMSFDIGSFSEVALGGSHHGDNRIKLWLQLMANFAMILIHRPGLSFDDTTAEFGKCLRTCLDCSQVILTTLSDSFIPLWLRSCKYTLSRPEGNPSLETSMAMISKGISILESDLQGSHFNGSTFYHESITEVTGTLQTLQSSLVQFAHAAADATNIMREHDDSNVFENEMWGSNALDDLNYMSATDWMGEMSGPFMGFVDLGGS